MAATDTFTAEWWGWLAADKLGYYNDLGLDVEFVPTGGSGDAVEQIIAGNLDAGNPSMPTVGEALLGARTSSTYSPTARVRSSGSSRRRIQVFQDRGPQGARRSVSPRRAVGKWPSRGGPTRREH
jgi:hypothetical protein